MTKNTKKVWGLAALLSVLAVGAYQAPPLAAQSQQDAVVAENAKLNMARRVRGGANVSDALNLYYVGTATEAVVTISATAMTFYAPAAVLDTTVGTAGVITYSSTLGENTVGALCDYLNGLTSTVTKYRCKLLDSKRDDAPGTVLRTQTATSGTNDLKAAGGFSVDLTTDTVISLGINPAKGKRVVLRHCQGNNEATGAGGDTSNRLYIYGQLFKHGSGKNLIDIGGAEGQTGIVGVAQNDTTEVYRSSMTQNTTIHVPPLTGYVDGLLEFATNAHVVVRASHLSPGSDAAQTANNEVACEWWEK